MKSNKKAPSANDIPCWNEENDIERIKKMFVDIGQARRIQLGQKPALRAVFSKVHGIAYGTFEMVPNLPEDLKVGVFELSKLDACVRFSSDILPKSPDLKSTCGVGLKLSGVEGKKLLGDGTTHDFIFQNHDVFFVDNAKDMAAFTTAGVVDRDYDAYIDNHPTTKRILAEMEKSVQSTLSIEYWSVLPYAFGDKRAVKYKLEPVAPIAGLPSNSNDYLALDLQNRLRKEAVEFKFLVQFFTDEAQTPLDKATVRWEEADSAPIHIATLRLHQQDITTTGQADFGENLSFNPWHALEVHRPLGSLSEARRLAYQASAEKRHQANGIPTQEPMQPLQPQPKTVESPEIDRDCIVRAAIYPAIGVCRIGNSEQYFIGPEVTHRDPQPASTFRDSEGKLKRQAARFRVYGLNALGEPVRELTAENAEIEWQVKLANQKSAWYQFQLAMDIPEAKDAPLSCLRNATVSNRKKLVIEDGPATICGRNLNSGPIAGTFMDIPVYLGELLTDNAGRLIVLGGLGKSASYDGSKAITFANNEGWHDDTSDGPVTATVQLNGVTLKVDPAWVITAPPDYAPDQKSVRTMWDLMRDTAIKAKMLPRPARPSFMHDIFPIFQRMTQLQWVNAGFAAGFGHGGIFNYTTPEWIAKLSNPSPAFLEVRKVLADHFRVHTRDGASPLPFPWLYGDAMDVPSSNSPRQNAALSDTQLMFLQQWAAGDFIPDYDPDYKHPQQISDLPVAEQPDMLIKASMEYCLADAFHPGCEMTWPMRNSGMYASAFRLKHAPKGWVSPPLSAYLDPGSVNNLLGIGQMAGDITRWMAVPWQTDTASCRSGYDRSYDPYLPTFWPARVPNQVLSDEAYKIVVNTEKTLGERLEAFAARTDWNAPLKVDPSTDPLNRMVSDFDTMGIVEMRKGVDNDPLFPTEIGVQVLKKDVSTALDETDSAVNVTSHKESNTTERVVHFRLSHRFDNEGQ